jgi:hypothetical protein
VLSRLFSGIVVGEQKKHSQLQASMSEDFLDAGITLWHHATS